MLTEKKDKITAKIKALLSKTTENGATKEEMESALVKANQLMTDFFISEYDLKDTEVIEKCISKQVSLIKSAFDLSYIYNDLCRLFDCKYYYNNVRIVFFGHEQDVELCCYFYTLITRTCLKEKDNYLKSENYKYLRKFRHGRTLSSSFVKGFLIEVCDKMEKMYKDRKSNIPQEYGLMVLEKEEKVKKEFEELDLKIKISKSKGLKYDELAFNDGQEAGEKMNLTQGIESCEEANRFAIGN